MKPSPLRVGPMLPHIDLANAITLAGLSMGLLASWLAIQGQPHLALVALVWAGVADMLDGPVARTLVRSEMAADMGKELDSLADMCSFGFAPAIIALQFGLGQHPLATLAVFVYLGAPAIRLAYFNRQGLDATSGRAMFTGLPVTSVAGLLPLAGLALPVMPDAWRVPFLCGVLLLLAAAMVSGLRIPKPGRRGVLVAGLLALLLTTFHAEAGYRQMLQDGLVRTNASDRP
ncbi:MAG: CDP-alcohol phosphatidyltransferase family protein [Candidatus Sericytochromatia bacterium]|nr:CDP-alcohol phosphatidyltransferase family protein [Candidatus Sericytochromatia bacterium]